MDDLISRQAAIDAIESAKTAQTPDGEIYVAKLNAEMNIQILPSAQPELIEKAAYIRGFEQGRTQGMIDAQPRLKGKWHVKNESFVVLDVCDKCMRSVRHVAPFYDFCPHCGADMREEEQDD